jgi:guanylate kinase
MAGQIYVITGPSGVGKGTLCRRLLQESEVLLPSISATSRPKRQGEEEGLDYFFKTREEFEAMIKDNALLEWAEYNGNYYGTPCEYVEDSLNQEYGILLEIEVQGALQVRNKFPEARLIFIAPPSMDALEARLRGRGTDEEAVIASRLKISQQEMTLQDRFDHVVVNDDLESCVQKLLAIISGSVSTARS